jgi:hypothetical protein
MTLTPSDYTSYSRQDLIDLCREKNVSGHSKKKVNELIELLIKAGVHPTKASAAPTPATPTPATPATPATPKSIAIAPNELHLGSL